MAFGSKQRFLQIVASHACESFLSHHLSDEVRNEFGRPQDQSRILENCGPADDPSFLGLHLFLLMVAVPIVLVVAVVDAASVSVEL